MATRSAYEYRRYWQGFVEDTRAERLAGDMNRFVRLKVTVTGAGGDARRTELVSPISPGWG